MGSNAPQNLSLNNSNGGAVLAALGFMVFSAIVGVSAFGLYDIYHQEYVINRDSEFRDLFATRMRILASTRDIVFGSIGVTENTNFHDCLIDDSAIDFNTANDCTTGERSPIILNDPVGIGNGPMVISGNTAQNAVRYSMNGKLCSQGGDCLRKTFAVWTEFFPTCSGGGACRQANEVNIRVHIIPSADFRLAPFDVETNLVFNVNNEWAVIRPAQPFPDGWVDYPIISGGGPGGPTILDGGGGDDDVVTTPTPLPPESCDPGFASMGGNGGGCRRFNL